MGNPVKCLAQGHNKRTCRLISTLTLLIADVKQGSCEYQLLKSFGVTRPGNRFQVYRQRAERSSQSATRPVQLLGLPDY